MANARVKVTGRLPMVGDLTGADVGPGLLHARLLTSAEAHAHVTVDTSAARRCPGVAAVFSGRDLEAALGRRLRFGPVLRDQPPLAVDRVRYAGDPVAVALASDPDDADAALRAGEVRSLRLP
nr:hypothetical protein [Micromonospora sp. DSM 115978]